MKHCSLRISTHVRPELSKVKPSAHSQRNEPWVFIQRPFEHTPGKTSHSLMSSHTRPFIRANPREQAVSISQRSHGLPQAAPSVEQHSDFRVAPLILTSQRLSCIVSQQVLFILSTQMVLVESSLLPWEHSQLKDPATLRHAPLMHGFDSHSLISSQVSESGLKTYPFGQEQVNEPGVFLHRPLSQSRRFTRHSLMSTQFFPLVSDS